MHDAFLKKLSSVEVLTEAERQAAIAICSNVRLVGRHQNVISEGADPQLVHIILQGWAARYNVGKDGSRTITAFLLPGDFCDVHVTVLAHMDHSIVALTDCHVAYVEPAKINEIALSTPALTRAFWRSSLIDEAILRRWLVKGGRSAALAAVGHLLCELHVRARLVGLTDDHSLALPVTQLDLADATGLTGVHMNRTLKMLREAGLATFARGELVIHDVHALRKMTEFDANYLHLSVHDSRP